MKKDYLKPEMAVIILKAKQSLLVGSTPDGGIESMEEETLYEDE